MKNLLLLIAAAIMLTSCSPMMDDDYRRIDPKIRPYVIDFVKEAQRRGIAVDTSVLKINFVSELSEGAQGRTFHNSNSIAIVESSYGWNTSPTTLIFHELGHLYLNREHDNTVEYDQVKSIMSGEFDPDFDHPETAFKRQYYVDELFNPSTAMPKWEMPIDTVRTTMNHITQIDFIKG